jgi:hypothetical protein
MLPEMEGREYIIMQACMHPYPMLFTPSGVIIN